MTATLAAVVSSLLLIGVVLSIAGIVKLVVQPGETHGLLPAVDSAAAVPQRLVGRIVVAVPLLHRTGPALTTLFGALAVFIAMRALCRGYVLQRINHHVGAGVSRIREHIHRQALRCNPGDLVGLHKAHAAELFGEKAQHLEDSARRWAAQRLTAGCDLTVLTVMMLLVQWRVGVECVIPIFVCWYIARVEADRHEASDNLLTEQVDRGLQSLTSDLEKSRVVAGYGMENVENEKFGERLQAYQQRRAKLFQQQRFSRWTSLTIRTASAMLPGFILARHLVFGEAVTLPVAVTLATVAGLILVALRHVQDVPRLYGNATVAADEINQYLRRVPGVSQVVGARFLEPMSRLLQFDQVAFETESHPELLSNLDLKIPARQRVALLSLNSAETQALVNLIPRFQDPSRGQVLVDGTDIRHVTLESLRAESVIVGGDDGLFNTSILDNITAGRSDISRQDAIEASKTVHAENFIRLLPRGYETDLAEHRITEPGQRFRLSLARAVARKPALLVIQEPEALDDETKAMLDDTYHRICTDRTVIFLPTRLSTVKKCDRVIMIHDGRVVEDGPHEQLVRSSALYRHWEYVRFNVFRREGD